jgi:3-oxoadipate enol-lactonase
VLGLLDHLSIDEATLVGHSQGGFLSLRATLSAPERVKALVLIDTAAVAWPPETVAQMGGMRDRFSHGGLDAVGPVLLGMLLGQPEIYQDWLQAWREQPQERLADAVTVLMGVDDISSRLGEISRPTLIMHGEADQAIPLARAEMLRDGLPGATDLIVIPGAGHTPSLTHPDQVNGPLSAFLRQAA